MIKSLILASTIVCLVGCGGSDQDDSGYFSDFTIENNSNYPLKVEYSLPSASGDETESEEIDIAETVNFYSAFDMASKIDYAPSPESTFSEMDIYVYLNDSYVLSYSVDSNSEWSKRIENDRTIYTLSVSDADLEL